MIVPLLGLSLMVQFPVTLEKGHVVKTVTAWVVSFMCISISFSLIYTSSDTFHLLKLSTLYPDDRSTYCDLNFKQCYCFNAGNGNGLSGDGECCRFNEDCASGNCNQTGPGNYDKFCVLQSRG